jgi:NADP-dependent 3-hydroxy acid dehydrogenase YdfG
MEQKIILITGATSGIGKATALHFADKGGYNIIITGRRLDRLNELVEKLNTYPTTKAIALNFDVRNRDEVLRAMESLPLEWTNIDILVNNAGLALGLSDIQDGDFDHWDTMIDTNVKGLLYMSKTVAQLMIKNNNQGHIINIGSIAGKEVYPKGNVYCATKHAVDALNKSMRIDLLPHQIKVTAVNPGMLETEFSLVRFEGDEEKAKQVYQGMQPLLPEDVAAVIYFAVNQPKHVCLNDITMTPTQQGSAKAVLRD